jgi:AraC-like DNA-binding protein
MSSQPLMRASMIRAAPGLMDRLGVTPGSVLRRAGFSQEVEAWETLFVTRAQALTLIDVASVLTGERHFAAHMGSLVLPDLGPVGVALMTAETLGEALAENNRNVRHIHQGVDFSLELRGGYAHLRQHLHGTAGIITRHFAEAWVGVTLTAFRLRLGMEWAPREIRLPFLPAAGGGALERIYGAPVVAAGRAPPSIVFDASVLTQWRSPIAEAAVPTPALPAWQGPQIVPALRSVVRGMVELQDVGLAKAARTMGVPARTLQWHLARQGLTFSGLVDRERCGLALQYLRDPACSITEVGASLGYSDTANFTRVFRRWFGVAPGMFRDPQRSHRGAEGATSGGATAPR